MLSVLVFSFLVLHRALPDLLRMKHKPDQAFGHREVFCFFLAECGIRFGANDDDARFGAKMVRSGVRGERDPLAPLLAAVMLLRPPAAPFSYRVIENRRH